MMMTVISSAPPFYMFSNLSHFKEKETDHTFLGSSPHQANLLAYFTFPLYFTLYNIIMSSYPHQNRLVVLTAQAYTVKQQDLHNIFPQKDSSDELKCTLLLLNHKSIHSFVYLLNLDLITIMTLHSQIFT